jgi:hypothetical protein
VLVVVPFVQVRVLRETYNIMFSTHAFKLNCFRKYVVTLITTSF